jgi:hypothetical protein
LVFSLHKSFKTYLDSDTDSSLIPTCKIRGFLVPHTKHPIRCYKTQGAKAWTALSHVASDDMEIVTNENEPLKSIAWEHQLKGKAQNG